MARSHLRRLDIAAVDHLLYEGNAVHTALQKLDNCCSVEDAMDICEPMMLNQIAKWKAAVAKGEAPLGLPIKGVGQDPSDAQPKMGGPPNPADALCGEIWKEKKDRIRKVSIMENFLVVICVEQDVAAVVYDEGGLKVAYVHSQLQTNA